MPCCPLNKSCLNNGLQTYRVAEEVRLGVCPRLGLSPRPSAPSFQQRPVPPSAAVLPPLTSTLSLSFPLPSLLSLPWWFLLLLSLNIYQAFYIHFGLAQLSPVLRGGHKDLVPDSLPTQSYSGHVLGPPFRAQMTKLWGPGVGHMTSLDRMLAFFDGVWG